MATSSKSPKDRGTREEHSTRLGTRPRKGPTLPPTAGDQAGWDCRASPRVVDSHCRGHFQIRSRSTRGHLPRGPIAPFLEPTRFGRIFFGPTEFRGAPNRRHIPTSPVADAAVPLG
jgi:hypothetical protein